MIGARERVPLQLFRIASIFVPSALAWHVAFSASAPSRVTEATAWALGPLCLLPFAALTFRCLYAALRKHRAGSARPALLDELDVLTASGSAMAWFSAGAIAASVVAGWASLAVVGLLGATTLHLVVAWTCLRAAGADPIGVASLARSFAPEIAVEGEPIVEELRFDGARIPLGFRLFVSGRVGPRWPTSRAVLEASESGGEVRIETDLGPALRGVHEAEPVELWLQDVFGLCRTPRLAAGPAQLTVLPRPCAVAGPRRLVGLGDGDGPEPLAHLVRAPRADGLPRPAVRMPTEGSFRLREYQPGDDARRIHWVRSLSAGEMVVRLPDEVLPDRPAVRLVLDTFLPGAEALACDTPAALLDALVTVWLGVGRALAQSGARVTLVLAMRGADSPQAKLCTRRWTSDAQPALLRLGAEAAWQSTLPIERVLAADAAASSVVVSCRVSAAGAPDGTRWILVRDPASTVFDAPFPAGSPAHLAHPMGSADNRWSRRRRASRRRYEALRDHATFGAMYGGRAVAPPGATFVVRQVGEGRVRLEALS